MTKLILRPNLFHIPTYLTTYLIFQHISCFQEKLILKNGIESGIPTVMAIDALLGGIDTTGEMFV
jgi:hypothetical protein